MRRVRTTALALASAAILAVTAAVALAAPASISNVGDTFNAPNYAHDAGTVAQYVHGGGNPHNVTATADGPDGLKLFRSATITSGSTPVNGTQYLNAGVYSFICTVHPTTMQATLTVTGTPLPRPTATLKVLDKKLAKVVKSSALRVQVTTSTAESTVVDAKLGKKPVAKTAELHAAGTKVVKLKLTRAGRNSLKKLKKAKLKVTGAPDFGSAATVSAKLK